MTVISRPLLPAFEIALCLLSTLENKKSLSGASCDELSDERCCLAHVICRRAQTTEIVILYYTSHPRQICKSFTHI
ncbi:hypothetical protein J6590_035659 [Homalodisca vitripennis]|nr:hypothetical protein J6590_035659 [Homalodisca vitripennis]